MTCEEFRDRFEQENPRPLNGLPTDLVEHERLCAACRDLVRDEAFWRRFFAASTASSPARSLWPGVLSKIREQLERRESFSASFVLFGRRLAPVFALLLLVALGFTIWRAAGVEAQDGLTMIAMVEEGAVRLDSLAEEPDALLESWLGADRQ
ncbi:MAG TPA: hypothetical protein VGB25_03345 [Candidatus Binatia bacterium]